MGKMSKKCPKTVQKVRNPHFSVFSTKNDNYMIFSYKFDGKLNYSREKSIHRENFSPLVPENYQFIKKKNWVR